jgi:hypothetical protein
MLCPVIDSAPIGGGYPDAAHELLIRRPEQRR